MNVTVGVLTYNSEEVIKQCLDSVSQQSYKNYQLIVVDNNSTDGTVEIVKKYTNNIFFHEGKIPRGRNLVLENASTKYVAFLDSDCIANSDWLEMLMQKVKEDPDVVAIQGDSVFANPNDVWARIEEEYYQKVHQRYIQSDGTYSSLDTKNSLLDREYVLSLGGFDENLMAAEDQDLGNKIIDSGQSIHYLEKAKVQHFHRSSLQGLFNKKTRDIQGMLLLARNGNRLFKHLKVHLIVHLILILLIILGYYWFWALGIACIVWFIYAVKSGLIMFILTGDIHHIFYRLIGQFAFYRVVWRFISGLKDVDPKPAQDIS